MIAADGTNNAVFVKSLDEVAAVLDAFLNAAAAGELDTAITRVAERQALHSNPGRPKLQQIPDANAPIIAALNDQARQTFKECHVVITQGVQALGDVDATLRQVQLFNAFTTDNDPYGEHDFGAIRYQGQTIFWKIDCYDLDLHMHSPDPSDETVTARVLTIMLAEEY